MLIYYNAIIMKQRSCSIFCAGAVISHHDSALFQKAGTTGLRTGSLSCMDVLCLSQGATLEIFSLLRNQSQNRVSALYPCPLSQSWGTTRVSSLLTTSCLFATLKFAESIFCNKGLLSKRKIFTRSVSEVGVWRGEAIIQLQWPRVFPSHVGY